jgi:transposase
MRQHASSHRQGGTREDAYVCGVAEDAKAVRVVLKLIARLYRLEREWNEADAEAERARDAAARARLRAAHFARRLRWLHALALALRTWHRPKSGMAESASSLS